VHKHEGGSGGHNGQPEYFAGMHQNRIHRADADQIMAFGAAAGFEHQHNETFTLGVEIRMRRDMHPPIVGGFVGRCEN
jgi:hypothetical protein